MQLTSVVIALAALVSSAAAAATATVTVSYDETYDNPNNSLDIVACSNGNHGLETLDYFDFGSLPDFPFIGGAAAIAGWNSPECGSCWQLTYNGKSINVLAIDHADSGFNIALEAMNALTDGQAVFLGRVNAVATQIDKSECGL